LERFRTVQDSAVQFRGIVWKASNLEARMADHPAPKWLPKSGGCKTNLVLSQVGEWEAFKIHLLKCRALEQAMVIAARCWASLGRCSMSVSAPSWTLKQPGCLQLGCRRSDSEKRKEAKNLELRTSIPRRF